MYDELIALNSNCSSVEVFNNEYFGQVRMSRDEEGEPLFCLVDVCKCLGLADPSNTSRQICAEFELPVLKTASFETGYGVKEFNMVTEPELYFIMNSCRKPEAKLFRKWVNTEVLPSIRKTGSYAVTKTPIEIIFQYSTNQLETAKAVAAMLELEEKKHQEALAAEHNIRKTVYDALNEIKQDYVGLYNTFIDNSSWSDMREVSAKLNIKGFGRNKIFQLLRDKGILDKSNIPYRKYIDNGYFKLSDAVRITKKGKMRFNKLMVSQSGKVFIEKLARKNFCK